jgi:hypothetical protein
MNDRLEATKRYYYVLVREYLLNAGDRFSEKDQIDR